MSRGQKERTFFSTLLPRTLLEMTILHTVACYRLKACAKQRAQVSITLAFHLRSAFPQTKQMFQHFPGTEILHSGNVHPLHAWSYCSLQIKCCTIKVRRPVKMPDFIYSGNQINLPKFFPIHIPPSL